MTSDIALSALRPAQFLELSPQTEMVRHAGGDSEDYTPVLQILDAPVPQTMAEVFEVWDRILQRTFEPQGELVPQERVQPHSIQQYTVLPLVDHIPFLDVVGVPVRQRTMKFCRLFVGRGCYRGFGCSFACSRRSWSTYLLRTMEGNHEVAGVAEVGRQRTATASRFPASDGYF